MANLEKNNMFTSLRVMATGMGNDKYTLDLEFSVDDGNIINELQKTDLGRRAIILLNEAFGEVKPYEPPSFGEQIAGERAKLRGEIMQEIYAELEAKGI